MRSYISLTFGLLILFGLPLLAETADLTSRVDKLKCTITRIDGPLVETSCKDFYFGEETKINDLTGQQILPFQVPLPCQAEIEVLCSPETKCTSISSILILQRIKVMPK